MKKSQILGAVLAAFAFLVLLLGVVLYIRGPNKTLASPETLFNSLPGKTPEEQEVVIIKFAEYDASDPQSEKALEYLRQIMKDPGMSPLARAAAIAALGSKRDWQAVPDIAECLYDEDNLILRRAAASACTQILGVSFNYAPTASPEERKMPADLYRAMAKRTFQDYKTGIKGKK